MAGRFSVESIFKGIDKISGPVKKMSRRVEKATRRMSNSFKKLERRIGGLTSFAKKAGVGIAAGLAIGTTALIGVVNTGAEFEQSLLNASAKFGAGLSKDSKEFTDLFDSLEKTAASIGKKTEFTAKAAAEGLDFLALAGFSAEQAIASLPGLVDLATASQTDLATASDIASDTLGAFGLASKDAATRAKNLQRVSDVLAKTSTTSNTSMQDFFETIKSGGIVFADSGASIGTFGALAGTLANSSLKGQKAGRQLKNFFLRLAKPTSAAAEELKKLKVETDDGNGNFRDSIDILADMEKGLEGMGTKQRQAAIATIFGGENITAINILLKKGTDQLRTYRKSLEDSTGASKQMSEIMRSGVGASIDQVKSAFEGMILTFFRTNKEGFAAIIEGITNWIRKVDLFLEKNKGMVEALSGDLFQTIVAGLKIFAGFVGMVVALNSVLLLSKVGILAWNIALGAYNAVSTIATFVTNGWALAQGALNVALSLNPIGLIIGLIAALGVAGFFLIKNWDKVKLFFVETWDTIVTTVQNSVETISALIDTITQPFKDLTAGVSGIKSKVSNFFGFSGGDSGKVVTPQEKMSRSISESRETSSTEVTIKAEKGTSAEITKQRGKGRGLTLQQSGVF